MPYSSCALVAQMIPNLLNGASSFDGLEANVLPGSAQLVRFMSAGCALIEAKLMSRGYSVPVPATAAVYDFVADVEATYAAFRAEAVRVSSRTGTGERTRAEILRNQFDKMLQDLVSMDLTYMGVPLADRWYVGGVSQAEKDTVESDTDRVGYRFGRGKFDGSQATSSS
uniref:Uncharacterized protein n=1 Tax=viral metagenome TaxID=1070528 RepID=A0A6M3IU11_9ZZZZ